MFSSDGSQHIVKSDINIDGGKVWEQVLADIGNTHSFEQVYNLNADTCPATLEKIISDSHNAAWSTLSGSPEKNRKSQIVVTNASSEKRKLDQI